MTLLKAKEVLLKNGILWTHYFDLDFIEHNMNINEANEDIYNAIKRIKLFITMNK